MKTKKFLTFIVFLSLIICGGCKRNPLDVTPSGRIDIQTVFSDQTTALNYLSTVYVDIPHYLENYWWFSMLAPKSDEAADGDYGVNALSSAQWNAGQLSPSYNPLTFNQTTTLNYYSVDWAGIRDANIYIENVEKVPNMSASLKNETLAEAKALRAYFYFELMRNYGSVPIITSSLPVDYDFSKLKRNTYDECAQFVASECDAAYTMLGATYLRRSSSEVNRVSGAFALALKSRVLLYNASPLNNPSNDATKWQKAADAAKAVLDLADQGVFALYSNYAQVFTKIDQGTDDNSFKEVIFQLSSANTVNQFFPAVNGIPSANGVKAGVCPSQELVDSYEMIDGTQPILGYTDQTHLAPIYNTNSSYDPSNPYNNRDPRLAASIFCNGALWGTINGTAHNVESFVGGSDGLIEQGSRTNTRTGYYIAKWIDTRIGNGNSQVAQGSTDLRWTIFRLAEFYLNYAEAENEVAGPTADVYAAVNKIRARAGIANLPAGLSQDQMRSRIRNERRVELAFEEHRFYDVRRWKILDQTDQLVTGMKITPASSVAGFNTNLYNPSSDHAPVAISSGSSVAIQFSASQAFNYVSAICPGYGTNTGGITFTLYKWTTNYTSTLATTPLGTISFTNFADNSTLSYTSSTQFPVGQYLFVISDPVNNVGVWQHTDSGGAGVNIFINGTAAAGSFESSYGLQSKAGNFNYQRIVVEQRSAYDSRFLIMPYPIGEIVKMPLVTQNPGW